MHERMKAMVLHKLSDITGAAEPLDYENVPKPVPGPGEVLLKVSACGVCHTELDIIEGRTPPPMMPLIPGHQVVGVVEALGQGAGIYKPGDRLGASWLYSVCGYCEYCRAGQENLCAQFNATGRDAQGGYAQYITLPETSAFLIPNIFTDEQAAPLLCAGAIGYRSLRLTGIRQGHTLGFTGFGASAHLVLQLAKHLYPNIKLFVFARNPRERAFAMELGADWAGNISDSPPDNMNAVIDTTPAWLPVLKAMEHLAPGGRLVINAIRKEDTDKSQLLKLDYARHLWMEKEIKSVANISRRDVSEFLNLAAGISLKPQLQIYPLDQANQALSELKEHKICGAKVLKVV